MALSMVRAYGLMDGPAEESVVPAPGGEVIARAQRGEEAAFECLYCQHSPRVYSLCLWMLGDEIEAQHVTQEAFLQAFRKIRAFRGDADFSTWLCGTTLALVLTRLRECPSRECSLDEIAPAGKVKVQGWPRPMEGLPRSRCTPTDRIRLEPAISELPASQRIVFVLHDVFGYGHGQIAAFLGCSPGNSKSQLHQARIRVRTLLRGMDLADPRSEQAMLKLEEPAR